MASKPHAVCFPIPGQGHINPMLKLAKILHYKGFHITFVLTEYNRNIILKSRGLNYSLDGLPDFCFETIPDGLSISPPANAILESLSTNCPDPFRALLYKLKFKDQSLSDSESNSNNYVPPAVTCIISDATISFPMEVAKEFGIPGVRLWTSSTCSLVCLRQFPRLVQEGLTPVTSTYNYLFTLKIIYICIGYYLPFSLLALLDMITNCTCLNIYMTDANGITNEYLDTVIERIPGMENIRFKDLPSFARTTDPNDPGLSYILKQVHASRDSKASALIINTFDSLEKDALKTISSLPPYDSVPIYSIGPLHLLANEIIVDSNLKTEQPDECLKWLDSKQPNSVVFVNFGSWVAMTHEQLIELAWGLANSKQEFLWIIRNDLVSDDKAAVLPPEFVSEIEGRGMLASWCPQDQVLNHPSIGGFLSHMGWNSTLETVSAGVPILCFPISADQQTNCWFACTKWGIGMEIDNDVKRDEVEMLVRELMEGEKGVEMKAKAMEWKKNAEEAIRPGGSSFQNLDELLTNVLSNN